MTRREFLSVASAAGILCNAAPRPLVVPIHLVFDANAKFRPDRLRRFWSPIWEEALREFEGCGVGLQCTQAAGYVERPANREPDVTGLDPAALNVVVTSRIPLAWDRGLSLSGVTTRYRGRHLCMVALYEAHGNQVPFLSLNTCVHELLHALLLDIFESRPDGLAGAAREFRIDWYATRLWLLGDGVAIRRGAQVYVERLRTDAARLSAATPPPAPPWPQSPGRSPATR
jgi:hypothetical protein